MSTLRTNEVEMLDGRGKGAITFDNVQEMIDSTVLFVGQKVRTLGYYSVGDGGGNDYEIVAAATGTDDGGSFIDLSGSGQQAKGLFSLYKAIEQWGCSPGAAENGPQLRAALLYMKDNPGQLQAGVGTYVVNDIGEVTAKTSVDNVLVDETKRACAFIYPGTHFVGHGRPKIATSESPQYIFALLDAANNVIKGFELEGAGATGNATHGIHTLMTGDSHVAKDVAFSDLYIHDVGSYGIGHQFGHADNFTYRNIRISDTGADGIDHKIRFGPKDSQFEGAMGVVLDGIFVERHGLRLGTNSGVDIRGAAQASNIHVRDFGNTETTTYGITLSAGIGEGDEYRTPSARTTLTNFTVEASSPDMNTIGVFCNSGGPASISNGYVHWARIGVETREATATPSPWIDSVSLSNIVCEGSRAASGSFYLNHSKTQVTGCRSISDIQYFDEKRGNLEAGQTTFSPVGGVIDETRTTVLLNGAETTAYTISAGDVVLDTAVESGDEVVIITACQRGVRVEKEHCGVIGFFADDYHTLGSISLTAAAAGTFIGAGNRYSDAFIDMRTVNGTPRIRSESADGSVADLLLEGTEGGMVRMGTHTGTALSVSGYIEIKDSSGIVRRLAVVS